jgi:hypothetical protein
LNPHELITIDDSSYPFRVSVSRSGVRKYGVGAVIYKLLRAYAHLLKQTFDRRFLASYAFVLARNVECIEKAMRYSKGVMDCPDVILAVRGFEDDPSKVIFGAAVDIPRPKKVIFINAGESRGRVYVTAYHELAHVAEYKARVRVDHSSLHILSVHVASEVVPLILKLKKEIPNV